jgi:serine/threonine protein kinase
MKVCGFGTHAVVYRIKDGKKALKKYKLNFHNSRLVAQKEFELAQTFKSHNLVQILAFNLVEGWIEMEFVDGISLAELVSHEGALEESLLLPILGDMLAGLSALHSHGLVHRDVKPSNVMRKSSNGICKLIDWIGKEEENISFLLGKPVGTPVFMAPEVVRTNRHAEQSDTWSLGCTVINLLSGRLPWANADAMGRTNEFMAMWKTANGEAPAQDNLTWSSSLRSFVARCFEPNVKLRAKAQDLQTDNLFLNHIT